jgi:hypothetical protein
MHSPAAAATYADVENHALGMEQGIAGTPGSITARKNANGTSFFVRQYYDHDGRKRDQYLASSQNEASDSVVIDWEQRIEEARQLQTSVRLLVREGYSTLSPKHLAAIMPLANHGVFKAGGVLIGTRAFEVIVNRLGVRAAPFATEDVDVARPGKLALERVPKGGLLEMLRESGIDFIDVPALRHKSPSTSFKEKGRSRFTFDLLVPTSGDEIETRPVPELGAHATALPYLRYLLSETQMGAALSTHGVAAVRVPVPERFALHKLIVACLRTGRTEKSLKDRRQASILIAALGEHFPGALEAAYVKLPASSRTYVRKSSEAIRHALEPHPRSWEELARLAKI